MSQANPFKVGDKITLRGELALGIEPGTIGIITTVNSMYECNTVKCTTRACGDYTGLLVSFAGRVVGG